MPEVLWEAGARCPEFTLTTRGALDVAREVRRVLPDDLLLAVGTVRTEQHAREADAGADFLVSQVLRPALVDLARGQGVPFITGTVTPPMMPTGGVGIHEIDDYLDRGAAAVGLSGPLLGDALLPGGDLDALAERARRATAATSAR